MRTIYKNYKDEFIEEENIFFTTSCEINFKEVDNSFDCDVYGFNHTETRIDEEVESINFDYIIATDENDKFLVVDTKLKQIIIDYITIQYNGL